MMSLKKEKFRLCPIISRVMGSFVQNLEKVNFEKSSKIKGFRTQKNRL